MWSRSLAAGCESRSSWAPSAGTLSTAFAAGGVGSAVADIGYVPRSQTGVTAIPPGRVSRFPMVVMTASRKGVALPVCACEVAELEWRAGASLVCYNSGHPESPVCLRPLTSENFAYS